MVTVETSSYLVVQKLEVAIMAVYTLVQPYTDTIQIGNTSLSSSTQTINIGTNNTTGGTTNITIGAGGSATGGTTAIQSKDDTTISTNGTQRARFSGGGDTLYVGNADGSGQGVDSNELHSSKVLAALAATSKVVH